MTSEEEFWELTDFANWGRASTDYEAIGRELAKEYNAKEIERFHDEGYRLVKELMKVYDLRDDSVELDLSDDGWHDFLWHIVGLGRNVYYTAYYEPWKYMGMGRRREFVESFSYCFQVAKEELSCAT